MIRITLVGLAIVTALIGTASAEDKMVYGAGSITCAEWQQYRSSGNKPASFQAQAWVDGYLSGSNASGDGPDFIAPEPTKVAYCAWIDNYCAQNPLNLPMVAVLKLEN